MKRLFFLGLVLVLALVSCGRKDSGWQGSIETIDGVRVVKNPGEPVYGDFIFELKEDLSLGGNPELDDYYFPKRISMAADDRGNIYVLDIGNFRVQKYDPAGRFVTGFGRRGQGPGEFQFPSYLGLDAEGNPWVNDSMARAVTLYSADGIYLEQKKLMVSVQSNILLSKEGFIFGYNTDYRAAGGPLSEVKKIRPGETEYEVTAFFQEKGDANSNWHAVHFYSNRLSFCPINTDRFCYGYPSEYKIYVSDGQGNTVLTIEKDEEPGVITGSEKEATTTDRKGIYMVVGRSPDDFRGTYFPAHRPFFSRLTVDDTGRIYAVRQPPISEMDEKTCGFDVFGKNGLYLYRTTLPFFPALIKNGSIYEIRTDEETGEIRLIRHAVKNWGLMKTEKN